MNLELLLEAERRGILPADKANLLKEARRRGLVPSAGSLPKDLSPGPLPSLAEMVSMPGRVDMDAIDKTYRKQTIGRPATAALNALQGLTLGAGAEMSATLAGAKNAITGGSPSVMDDGTIVERYKEGYGSALRGNRNALAASRETHPGTAIASEIAGAVTSPASLMAAPAIAKSATLAGSALKGGASGATGGAVYGFLSGENDVGERTRASVVPAAIGAAVGAGRP